MHYWINPSLIKINTPTIGSVRGHRPKGLKDEEWNSLLADEVLNRQIVLNTVPKPSKKDRPQKKN
jgi:hypothetical protein